MTCFQTVLVMYILGHGLAISVPKHFLQGTRLGADIFKSPRLFRGCKPWRNCAEEKASVRPFENSKPAGSTIRERYPSVKAPVIKPSSPRDISREIPRRISKPPVGTGRVTQADNAGSRKICNKNEQRDVSKQNHGDDVTKYRNLRQSHLGLNRPGPPAKILVIIDGLINGSIDKMPLMNVRMAIRKVLYRDRPSSHMILIRESNCQRISIIGASSGTNSLWRITLRDENNQVLYNSRCYIEGLELNPGYSIYLTNGTMDGVPV